MAQRDKYRGCPVIEGVAFSGGQKKEIACRNEFHDIVSREWIKNPNFHGLESLPLARGLVFFFREAVAFFAALLWSARQAGASEDENMGWLQMIGGLFSAVLVCFFLYLLLPAVVVTAVKLFFGQTLAIWLNFIIKVALFLLLLQTLRRTESVKRLWAYHGAAHKAVHAQIAAEQGEENAWENISDYSSIHSGCASSYVLSSFLYLIVVSSFCIYLPALGRVFIEILLFLLIFGVNYEIYRCYWQGNDGLIWKIFTAPGLFLQRFTVREPNWDMMEIAVAAAARLRGETDEWLGDTGAQWAEEQLKTWAAEKRKTSFILRRSQNVAAIQEKTEKKQAKPGFIPLLQRKFSSSKRATAEKTVADSFTAATNAETLTALHDKGAALGETLHDKGAALGETLHEKGAALGETLHEKGAALGETLHEKGAALGETLHEKGAALGETLHDKGAALGETLHDKGAALGETLHEKGAAAGEALREKGAARGETLHDKGAALGETLHEKGAALGETLHDKGAALGETLHEKGAALGETLHEKGAALGETLHDKGAALGETLRQWGKRAAASTAKAAEKTGQVLLIAGDFSARKARDFAKTLRRGAALAGPRLMKAGETCKVAGAKSKAWLKKTWYEGKSRIQTANAGRNHGGASVSDEKAAVGAASAEQSQSALPSLKSAATVEQMDVEKQSQEKWQDLQHSGEKERQNGQSGTGEKENNQPSQGKQRQQQKQPNQQKQRRQQKQPNQQKQRQQQKQPNQQKQRQQQKQPNQQKQWQKSSATTAATSVSIWSGEEEQWRETREMEAQYRPPEKPLFDPKEAEKLSAEKEQLFQRLQGIERNFQEKEREKEIAISQAIERFSAPTGQPQTAAKPAAQSKTGGKPKSNKSQGNKSQGNKSQGNKSQGNKSQGNKSQGNKSQGNKSQGNKSQGNKSHGNKSQGNKSQNKKPQNNKPQGNKSQGNKSQGNKSQGNKSQGNKSQGNKSQGNKSSTDKA